MKKNKHLIFLLIFLFLVSACQNTKKSFSGKKIEQGEEFLVIKKNPLEVPPDFEKMPLPKNENDNSSSNNVENNQDSDFKKLLKTRAEKKDVSDLSQNTGDLEKKIIDKIK